MADSIAGKTLELDGSTAQPLRWLIVLTSIPIVVAVVVVAFVATRSGHSAAAPPLWILLLVPALIVLVQVLIVRGIRKAGVSVSGGDLVINTGIGTKRVALSHLRARGLRVVDLDQHSELKPRVRTRGTGLPGFSSGWFRLRNGEKAVCILLGRARVSYLRSEVDDLSVLLSLREPDVLRGLLER